MGDQGPGPWVTLLPSLPCPALSATALLGILYEDKERQDFIFTIYHWWQAVAIFVVYLGSSLPMKVRLSGLGEGLWGIRHPPSPRSGNRSLPSAHPGLVAPKGTTHQGLAPNPAFTRSLTS